MNHPLLHTVPDEHYSYDHLRTGLSELNDVLEGLKDQPSTQPFAKATTSVQALCDFNPTLDRQWSTDQQKILASTLITQGVDVPDKSLLTVGQNGILIAYDMDTGLKYEAISVGKGNNLALAASPEGSLVAVGGLSCTVDVYPVNEALQADFGLRRPEHDFNHQPDEASIEPEPYMAGVDLPSPGEPSEPNSPTRPGSRATPRGSIISKTPTPISYDFPVATGFSSGFTSPTSPVASPTSPVASSMGSPTTPIDAIFKHMNAAPINPTRLNTQREIMRANTEEAVKFIPRARVAKSHRFVPQGSTGVTNLFASFMGHRGSVQALEFLDEYHLVSGSADCGLISWDMAEGRASHIFNGHSGPVNEVSSLGNNTFVSVGTDGYILLWDNRTAQPQFSFESAIELPVNSVVTMIPGICFATAYGGHVECFDIRALNSLFHTPSIGPGNDIVTLASSESGRVIVAGGSTGNCGVVDVLRGQWSGIFRAHNDVTTSTHVYENRVLTTSYDSVVKLWKPNI